MVGDLAHWLRDEEATGSNPATPTRRPQVTRHPVACGSRSASPGVRFGSDMGTDLGQVTPCGAGETRRRGRVEIVDVAATLEKRCASSLRSLSATNSFGKPPALTRVLRASWSRFGDHALSGHQAVFGKDPAG